jgi:hypothetical protein
VSVIWVTRLWLRLAVLWLAYRACNCTSRTVTRDVPLGTCPHRHVPNCRKQHTDAQRRHGPLSVDGPCRQVCEKVTHTHTHTHTHTTQHTHTHTHMRRHFIAMRAAPKREDEKSCVSQTKKGGRVAQWQLQS